MKKILTQLKQLLPADWLLAATLCLTGWLSIAFYRLTVCPVTRVTHFDLFFGDIVPVAILFAVAFYTRRSFAGILFVLCSVAAVALRIGEYFLFDAGSLSLRYSSLALLWEHYDHRSAQTMVGTYYLPFSILAGILAVILIALLARSVVRSIRTCPDESRDKRLILAFILILLGFAAHGNVLYQKYSSEDGEDFYVGHAVTPMPFLVNDILKDMTCTLLPAGQKKGFVPGNFSAEEKAFLKNTGLTDAPPCGPAPDVPFDRILVVALESLDSDFLSSCNPEMPENLTAGLDALKQKYLSFDNFFCGALPTSWGLTTYFLSRTDYLRDQELETTPFCRILREDHGIMSCYFSPIRGTFGENRDRYKDLFDYDCGFFEKELKERYDFMEDNKEWGFTDSSMYRAAMQFIKEEKPDKFFILISTMDSHAPYTPTGPCKDDGAFSGHGRFFQMMHCVDRNLTDFVEQFTADPELFNERTLLIITADHAASHGDNYTRRKGLGYPARIPLILISKNNRAAGYFKGITDKYCSSPDLPATLLAMLGSEIPESFMGQDIRTKKSFALGKTTMDEVQLFLPDNKVITINTTEPLSKKSVERRALQKFYQQYYPAEK